MAIRGYLLGRVTQSLVIVLTVLVRPTPEPFPEVKVAWPGARQRSKQSLIFLAPPSAAPWGAPLPWEENWGLQYLEHCFYLPLGLFRILLRPAGLPELQ